MPQKKRSGARKALDLAKANRNDEFYTPYFYIDKEINAYVKHTPDLFVGKTVLCPCDDPEWSNFAKFFATNFDRLGLKRLICTSYSAHFHGDVHGTPSLFSLADESEENVEPGRVFICDSQPEDPCRLEWSYLEGNGDFRSSEVSAFRDEADFVFTNPPFSLVKHFIPWLVEGGVRFAVIAPLNAATYKGIAPLILSEQIWAGTEREQWLFELPPNATYASVTSFDRVFNTLGEYADPEKKYASISSTMWWTNIDHTTCVNRPNIVTGTMEEHIASGKNELLSKYGYLTYDNADAIEVPSYTLIPSDYDGVMGVPLSFIEYHDPRLFEIVGLLKGAIPCSLVKPVYIHSAKSTCDPLKGSDPYLTYDGHQRELYSRLLIRHKR